MTKMVSNNHGFCLPKISNQKQRPSKVGKILHGGPIALLIKHNVGIIIQTFGELSAFKALKALLTLKV